MARRQDRSSKPDVTGFSPPPPPQAARAFVRQLFSRRSSAPEITATLSDEPGSGHATLEFVNEGAEAVGLVCLCRTGLGLEELELGRLGPRSTTSATVGAEAGPFQCVWSCADRRGRRYVWSYEGRRHRLRGRDRRTLEALFAAAYP